MEKKEKIKGVVYDFDKPKSPHAVFSEELLVPFTNHCSPQRINMFASHLQQFVHLKNAEAPKVFTGFENQVGKYSVAYKRSDKNYTVLGKIVKNKFNYVLIVQDDEGVFDVIQVHAAKNITESYGYALKDTLKDKTIGSIIKKDDLLYSSDFYDDDMNLQYGVNLKAVYLNMQNKTYED